MLRGHKGPRRSARPMISPFGFRMVTSDKDTFSGPFPHRRGRLLCMGASAQCRGNCPKVQKKSDSAWERAASCAAEDLRSTEKVTCGQGTGEAGRPAEREVWKNLWQRSQGDRDSWNGSF